MIANRIHVIERAEGAKRLILPFWRERARGAELTEDCPTLTGGGHETSGVLISDDLGQSWVPAGRIADPKGQTWLIEGTVASAGSGELCAIIPLKRHAVCTKVIAIFYAYNECPALLLQAHAAAEYD